MTARFYPPLFRFAPWAVCLAFLLSVSPTSTAEYQGPIFPCERAANSRLSEPLPLPKQNPLLQRPSNSKQVIFDDLDMVDSIVPLEEDLDIQLERRIRQNRIPARTSSILDTDSTIFMDEVGYYQSEMWQPIEGCGGKIVEGHNCEMGPYFSGPIPITFGMGLFDNLTLSAETTTFKTELNNGAGSYGLGQGINWSLPVTPQGTVTAQYGARTVQGDLFAPSARHQTFMTAGVFKRFPIATIQGGVAVDWLYDRSIFGSVNVRQMRCELSARSSRNVEYGFIGCFDVFHDRPTTPRIDREAVARGLSNFGGVVNAQDYYLLFVRKHLNTGGQVELRCGATERGDFITSAIGEVAISDRLAINGGISVLAPAGGKSVQGNYRESWSVSMGVILYFRGGAMSRPANLYRPMFDVAGNNSFFTRIAGR